MVTVNLKTLSVDLRRMNVNFKNGSFRTNKSSELTIPESGHLQVQAWVPRNDVWGGLQPPHTKSRGHGIEQLTDMGLVYPDKYAFSESLALTKSFGG